MEWNRQRRKKKEEEERAKALARAAQKRAQENREERRSKIIKRVGFWAGLAGAAALAVGGIGYFLGGQDEDAGDNGSPALTSGRNIQSEENPQYSEWGFLSDSADRDYLWQKRERTKEEVMREGVRIGKPRNVNNDPILSEKIRSSLLPLLEREIRAKRYDLQARWLIKTIEQTKYCIPPEAKNAEAALKYCKIAKQYLSERIRGEEFKKLEFIVIRPGDDFSNNFYDKAFLIHQQYDLTRVVVENAQDPSQKCEFNSCIKDSLDQVTIDDAGKYVELFSRKQIVYSVFSELTALVISAQQLKEHEAKKGALRARQAAEALTEASSYHITRELMQKLNISAEELLNREYKVKDWKKGYEYVPYAISWIEEQSQAGRDGIRMAWDLYMEDPEKFMKTIGAEADKK